MKTTKHENRIFVLEWIVLPKICRQWYQSTYTHTLTAWKNANANKETLCTYINTLAIPKTRRQVINILWWNTNDSPEFTFSHIILKSSVFTSLFLYLLGTCAISSEHLIFPNFIVVLFLLGCLTLNLYFSSLGIALFACLLLRIEANSLTKINGVYIRKQDYCGCSTCFSSTFERYWL